jgi:hypothetical protein
LKYENDNHDTHNIFESVEVFNNEMEDETGIEFAHSLHCVVEEKKSKGNFVMPRPFWWLMNHADFNFTSIGEYLGNDADFMKRFLAAHRAAFTKMLKKEHGWKPKIIGEAYQRWHNRAMRGLPGLESEADLLKAQDAFEE